MAAQPDSNTLKALYSTQYPENVTNRFKAVRKYVQKALQHDLNDISKHYNSLSSQSSNCSLLWVAVIPIPTKRSITNTNTNVNINDSDAKIEQQAIGDKIVGMIGIRPNVGWNGSILASYDTNKDINKQLKSEPSRIDKNGNGADSASDVKYQNTTNDGDDGDGSRMNINCNYKIAEIVRFGVQYEYRNKGIGSELLNYVSKYCIKNGYDILVATTMNVLNDAILFYNKNGFVLNNSENCGKSGELKFLRFAKLLSESNINVNRSVALTNTKINGRLSGKERRVCDSNDILSGSNNIIVNKNRNLQAARINNININKNYKKKENNNIDNMNSNFSESLISVEQLWCHWIKNCCKY